MRVRDDSDQLIVAATAFAETQDAQRIQPPQSHIELGLWCSGVRAIWKCYTGPPLPAQPSEELAVLQNYRLQRQDVEDAVNQMLGRDPEQAAPPTLSWAPLIAALRVHQIEATQEELLAVPFRFEFTGALLAALDGLRGGEANAAEPT